MFNRFFSKKAIDDKKSESLEEYDLRNLPQTEEELKLFIKHANFLLTCAEKDIVTDQGVRELLDWDGCLDKYGSDFSNFVRTTVKNVKAVDVDDMMKRIAHPFSFIAYKYNPGITQDFAITIDEYKEKCTKFIKEAELLPYLPDLLDIRTMCYQIGQLLTDGKLKTTEKYTDTLIGFTKKIEAMEGLKERYLPPAEHVYQIVTKQEFKP